MFAACLLLIIATIGGTLLTFLFDRSTPTAARLCMGASIGMALMATIGFVLALVLGLGDATIILTSFILLLPLLLLANRERRAFILNILRPRHSCPWGIGRYWHRPSGFLSRHRHSAGDGFWPRCFRAH